MKTSIDCIPCLIRQIIEASRFFSDDAAFHEKILRDTLTTLCEADLSVSPPVLAQNIHRRMRKISGIEDPYRNIKDRFNSMALSMIGLLKQEINRAPDPMLAAVRFSIAGNVIDCGAKTGLRETEAAELALFSVSEILRGKVNEFLEAAKNAKNIFYIADNAGEIVFDRLLIEMLGPSRVTLGVRGLPVINDATIVDAQAAGLDKIVTVTGPR